MTWFQKDQEPHRFRERTEKHRSCCGVMSPTFICKACKRPRTVVGRKERVPGYRKLGYICAECAA